MNVEQEISSYINSHDGTKRTDMEALHQIIGQIMSGCRLWFLDGKDSNNKTVSNPNIGYGQQTMRYADGSDREFYQIGLSSNTSGISVYIMGLEDKKYLPDTYADKIGKASVTGYCIKFRKLADINIEVLKSAIMYRLSK